MSTLTIDVAGKPSPKGSLKHVGKGRLVEQVKGSKPWRETVAAAARESIAVNGWTTSAGPVVVNIDLYIVRPKSSRQTRPITRSSGDVDKHARNVLDALVDAGVIGDDSQVVGLAIRKDHGAEAGAHIFVEEVTP